MGESVDARADLALAELLRIGAFERRLLVIATPTGTGWVDPAAMMPLEILHRGDVATVSVQYSYLPSWLSLLVEPTYGRETAGPSFVRSTGIGTPCREDRPRFFLFGLSLGALIPISPATPSTSSATPTMALSGWDRRSPAAHGVR